MPVIYKNNINYGGVTFLAGSGVTAGIITAYGGTTAPTGWLLCDGSAVSRETYSELFKAIGTTYGSGDESTTFNLPDLVGDFIIEEGTSGQWTYKKWASGIAECWGIFDTTSVTVARTYGNIYITQNSIPAIDYPFTFYQVPTETEAINAANTWIMYNDSQTTSKTKNFFLAQAVARTTAASFSITYHAKGLWKAYSSPSTNYIISIGQQNGGFTHIEYDSTEDEYAGGIEDKYLLTQDTIDDLVDAGYVLGSDESGVIDQAINYFAENNNQEHESLGTGVDAYKRNGIVTIIVYKTSSISTSYTNIGTLPVGWRPPMTFYSPGYIPSTDVSVSTLFAVDANNGGILVKRIAGSGNTSYGGIMTFSVA